MKYQFECPKCGNDQFVARYDDVICYAIADGCGDNQINYWDAELDDYCMDESKLVKFFCENFDCDWVAPFTTEEEMMIFLKESAVKQFTGFEHGPRRSAMMDIEWVCNECEQRGFVPVDNSLEEHEHKHLQCPFCGSVKIEEVEVIK